MKLYDNYEPLVSVVLPTYNREKLIRRAIDSVLRQTLEKWELIIVDDGSDDGTFEIINEIIKKEKRVKYLKQQNMKLPVALNNGISISAGKFVTFLGSDDEYLPNHLETRVNEALKNPEIDFFHGGVKIIGNPFVPDKNDVSKKIHLKDCVIGGTFFAKKEVFVKTGGFNLLDYSEDSEFFERAEKMFAVKKLDFPTYVYHRDTEGSITNELLSHFDK